ncbi:MAG: nucleotide pyrophosphohydrolase, partial [Desulfuromonadales bacterium]
LPGNLPALQRAQKLMARAMRTGLDKEEPFPQLATGRILTEDELGRALLTLAKQAEMSGLDAEQALRRTVRKLFEAAASNAVK